MDYDLDLSDAFAKNANTVAQTILSEAQPGSIIVLHLNGAPNAALTADILRQVVPGLAAQDSPQ